jgi:uncharacterized protein (DUF302 family)
MSSEMMEFDYTVPTGKSYRDALAAVQERLAAHQFRVQFVHDVQATITEKGFPCEPISIVETCNAKYASQVLAADPLIALMLPCPVVVYEKDGATSISTLRPSVIGAFYPEAGIQDVADEVDAILRAVVDEAAA